MTALATLNSADVIQTRIAEGRMPRYGPILMLFARSAFILLAQGIAYLVLFLLNILNAAIVLRNW